MADFGNSGDWLAEKLFFLRLEAYLLRGWLAERLRGWLAAVDDG